MRLLPAPAGKGIVFRRIDLDNFELQADVGSVERVAYATSAEVSGDTSRVVGYAGALLGP